MPAGMRFYQNNEKRCDAGHTSCFLAATGQISAAAAAATVLVLGMIAAVSVPAGLRLGKLSLAGWEKLIHRELEVLEECAGIGGIACTFLVGHTEVIGGHQQLDVPFQFDDAELSQRHEQLSAVAVDHQILFKTTANISRNVCSRATAVTAAIQGFAAENHWIHNLYDCHRQIGTLGILHILSIPAAIRTEDTGAAFAAEQYRSLIIDSQTIQCFGAAYTAGCIQRNAVEIPDIHRIESTVIGDGFHVNGCVKQLGIAGLDIDRIFQNRLGCAGQIDTKIPETLFFTTGIIDFARMDTNGLLWCGISAERARRNLFRHIVEPPE